jgi:hypothetical protein
MVPIGLTKLNEHFVFPCGMGVWWHEELLFAQQHGTKIVRLASAYIFDNVQPILKKDVDFLYAQRLIAKQKCDQINDQIYKLLLNTGRLEMKENLSQTFVIPNKHLDVIKSVFELSCSKKFEKSALVTIEQSEPCDTFSRKEQNLIHEIRLGLNASSQRSTYSAVAAAITSKARIELYKRLLEMEDHVYYCDTDSVYTDKPLPMLTSLF